MSCCSAGLCVALYILTCASLGFSQDTARLNLQVSIENQKKEYVLQIRLINDSPERVTIRNLDLPWIPPNEFAFVKRAYRMDKARTQVEQFGPMADYMDVFHELGPGESLDGYIKLRDMFPSLFKDAEQFGVTIEWSCRSKRLEFRCKEGEGGKFVIAKNQPRNSRKTSPIASPNSTIPRMK